ncbi:MAG: c-type cytochrome [Acidiferrobacterales bacterium]
MGNRGFARKVVTLFFLGVVASGHTLAGEPQPSDSGKEIYEEYCAACHGYDGVPILPGSPNFSKGERLDKTDAELLKTISDGKGDIMPPWKEVLSEQQRKNVLHYLRSIGHE